MAIELGAGYLSVLPSTDKLAPGVTKAFKEMQGIADKAGKNMGSDLANGIKGGLKDAEKDANYSGKTIGKNISSGVKKGADDSAKAIKGALKEGTSTAKREGMQAGHQYGSAFTGGISSIGTKVKETFGSLEKNAKATGARIKKSLSGANDSAAKGGKSKGGSGAAGIGGGAGIGAVAGGPVGAAIGAAVVGGGILLKGFTNDASDMNETLSKSQTIFGSASKDIEKFGSNAAKSLGLSKEEAISGAAAFGNFFDQIGIGKKQSANLAKGFLQMSGDLASFNNADPSEVMESFQAATRGEYDSLQKFIPSVNAAKVETEALRLSHKKSAKDLTDADKAQALYNLSIKGQGKAQGDFARTSQGAANQQRILSAELKNARASIGNGLLPIFTKLLVFINTTAIPGVKSLASGFTTYVMPVLSSFGGFIKNNILPVLSAFGAWFVTNIVPKLLAFAGFLQNNVLPVIIGLGEWIGTRILANLKIFGAWFQTDILPKLQQFVGFIQANVVPVLAVLGTFIVTKVIPAIKAMVDWFGNHILPVLLKVVGFIVGVLIKALEGIWTVIFTKIIPVITWLLTSVIIPVFAAIGKVFMWLLNTIVIPVFTVIASFLVGVWTRLIYPMFQVFSWVIRNVVGPAIGWLYDHIVKPVFGAIGGYFKSQWDNVIHPVLSVLGSFIEDKVAPAISKGVAKVKGIWDTLQGIFLTPINFLIGTVYNNGIRKVINALPGVDDVPEIGLLGQGGPGRDTHRTGKNTPSFAIGGAVSGLGRKGIDSITAMLAPGEHVWTAKEVDAAGGQGAMYAMRKAILRGKGMGKSFDPPAFAGGGTLSNDQIARAQAFAKSQVGDPYTWGGVGPNGFDCSGFMSAITNVILGRNPYSRVGATGSFPWGGFESGPGQFTIGSTKNYGGSGVGHMAGTLGGMNVESRGGQGVVVGPGARGYKDSGFNTVAHLGTAGVDDGFFANIKGVLGSLKGWIKELGDMNGFGGMLKQMVQGVSSKVTGFINDAIPGPGPIKGGIFDNGGILQPGAIAFNASNKPEAVFNHKQFAAYANDKQAAPSTGQTAFTITNWKTGEGYFREIAGQEIDDAADYAASTNRRNR